MFQGEKREDEREVCETKKKESAGDLWPFPLDYENKQDRWGGGLTCLGKYNTTSESMCLSAITFPTS